MSYKPLPGTVVSSFRGVTFFVPDVSSEVGRRVAEHLFPGLDYAAYDDHGLLQESFSIEGVYVGDDYIAHHDQLKRAFETPGPATFIHPWRGPLNVILTEPATLSLSSEELRAVRISASFKLVPEAPRQNGMGNSNPALISKALSFAQTAFHLMNAANRTLSRLRTDATARTGNRFLSLINGFGGGQAGQLQAFLPANPPTTPKDFASLITKTTQALVDLTFDPADLSAVAPAAGAMNDKAPLSNQQALDIGLAISGNLTNDLETLPSNTDLVLQTGAAADSLAKTALLVADCEPASRKEALVLRNQLSEICDHLSNGLQSLLETDFSGEASATMRAAKDLRVAIIADINETIGRLPKTALIKTDQPLDAYRLAHALYGDNPTAVENGYLDIIARNRPRHPARLESGQIEVIPNE